MDPSAFSCPAADTVIVWRLSLSLSAKALVRCKAVLSAKERMQADKLLRPEGQRRLIACWGQVRRILGACLKQSPEAVHFIRGQWGKPFLPGPEGIVFNLSHSQDYLLLAVGRHRALGVDVEAIRPHANLERLARRCLAPAEWKTWTSLAKADRLTGFLRFWTLKEALAKAHGRGLGLGIQHCAFALDDRARLLTAPKECGPAASWTVHELTRKDNYCAALCARPGNIRVVDRCLPADWIENF